MTTLLERRLIRRRILKGEAKDHPYRGNQYDGGIPGVPHAVQNEMSFSGTPLNSLYEYKHPGGNADNGNRFFLASLPGGKYHIVEIQLKGGEWKVSHVISTSTPGTWVSENAPQGKNMLLGPNLLPKALEGKVMPVRVHPNLLATGSAHPAGQYTVTIHPTTGDKGESHVVTSHLDSSLPVGKNTTSYLLATTGGKKMTPDQKAKLKSLGVGDNVVVGDQKHTITAISSTKTGVTVNVSLDDGSQYGISTATGKVWTKKAPFDLLGIINGSKTEPTPPSQSKAALYHEVFTDVKPHLYPSGTATAHFTVGGNGVLEAGAKIARMVASYGGTTTDHGSGNQFTVTAVVEGQNGYHLVQVQTPDGSKLQWLTKLQSDGVTHKIEQSNYAGPNKLDVIASLYEATGGSTGIQVKVNGAGGNGGVNLTIPEHFSGFPTAWVGQTGPNVYAKNDVGDWAIVNNKTGELQSFYSADTTTAQNWAEHFVSNGTTLYGTPAYGAGSKTPGLDSIVSGHDTSAGDAALVQSKKWVSVKDTKLKGGNSNALHIGDQYTITDPNHTDKPTTGIVTAVLATSGLGLQVIQADHVQHTGTESKMQLVVEHTTGIGNYQIKSFTKATDNPLANAVLQAQAGTPITGEATVASGGGGTTTTPHVPDVMPKGKAIAQVPAKPGDPVGHKVGVAPKGQALTGTAHYPEQIPQEKAVVFDGKKVEAGDMVGPHQVVAVYASPVQSGKGDAGQAGQQIKLSNGQWVTTTPQGTVYQQMHDLPGYTATGIPAHEQGGKGYDLGSPEVGTKVIGAEGGDTIYGLHVTEFVPKSHITAGGIQIPLTATNKIKSIDAIFGQANTANYPKSMKPQDHGSPDVGAALDTSKVKPGDKLYGLTVDQAVLQSSGDGAKHYVSITSGQDQYVAEVSNGVVTKLPSIDPEHIPAGYQHTPSQQQIISAAALSQAAAISGQAVDSLGLSAPVDPVSAETTPNTSTKKISGSIHADFTAHKSSPTGSYDSTLLDDLHFITTKHAGSASTPRTAAKVFIANGFQTIGKSVQAKYIVGQNATVTTKDTHGAQAMLQAFFDAPFNDTKLYRGTSMPDGFPQTKSEAFAVWQELWNRTKAGEDGHTLEWVGASFSENQSTSHGFGSQYGSKQEIMYETTRHKGLKNHNNNLGETEWLLGGQFRMTGAPWVDGKFIHVPIEQIGVFPPNHSIAAAVGLVEGKASAGHTHVTGSVEATDNPLASTSLGHNPKPVGSTLFGHPVTTSSGAFASITKPDGTIVQYQLVSGKWKKYSVDGKMMKMDDALEPVELKVVLPGSGGVFISDLYDNQDAVNPEFTHLAKPPVDVEKTMNRRMRRARRKQQ